MSNVHGQRLRQIEQDVARIQSQVGDIHGWMQESDARPSLPVRVDRLERFQRGAARVGFAAIVSLLTATGAWVISTIVGPRG